MHTNQRAVLADDAEVVRRILAHIDAGTTDAGPAWREPVRNYLDPARFAEELAVLRGAPSVFVPSAVIAEPGDYLERSAFGVPLIAVRDRELRARVFRNACRHRGATLVDGRGCARAFVCRYHGWTYRLDGALTHVPHAEAFPDLDLSTRGLVEVPSREVDGLVVIDALAPLRAADSNMSALTDGAPWREKLLPSTRVIDVSQVVMPINWKVLVEQFLEGYHIRTTHRDTFYPIQYDDLNVVETFGPHSRITYPYRNIERLRERPEATWTVKHRLTYLYQLFPNVMVATFPDRVIIVVADPVDVGHTKLSTYSLAEPVPESATPQAGEGPNLVALGAAEDNAMSLAVQRGFAAGANEFVEFGRHESAIGHFHATLDERLRTQPRAER